MSTIQKYQDFLLSQKKEKEKEKEKNIIIHYEVLFFKRERSVVLFNYGVPFKKYNLKKDCSFCWVRKAANNIAFFLECVTCVVLA